MWNNITTKSIPLIQKTRIKKTVTRNHSRISRRNILINPQNRRLRYRFYRTEIKHVTVYGSGIMGSGIAQIAAQAGYEVMIVDIDNNSLLNAKRLLREV